MSVYQQLIEIEETLCQLKEIDREFRVFGASTHRYELFAPLSATLIESFEHEFQLKLPEDYSLFLTKMGNGGAGPFYGIMPLERAKISCTPQELFRWSDENVVEFVEDADYDEWHDFRRGVVEICEEGCGTNDFLVVKGNSFGTVWTDAWHKLIPHNLGFIDFYGGWATRNLQKLKNIPLIERAAVGMSKDDLIDIFGTKFHETILKDVWDLGENGQIQCVFFENVPAAFLMHEDKVVKINDQSDYLV